MGAVVVVVMVRITRCRMNKPIENRKSDQGLKE